MRRCALPCGKAKKSRTHIVGERETHKGGRVCVRGGDEENRRVWYEENECTR